MGLIGNLIIKGVATVARNSTIKAVGDATIGVISATAQKQAQKDDIVVKNGKVHIKPTRSSENYIGENALDVAQELLGVGFEKITLKPIKKLSEKSTKKYGQIKSISINGNEEFLGIKRVPATSHIVIKYLDFNANASSNIYNSVRQINCGTISDLNELEIYPANDDTKKTKVESTDKNCSSKTKCFCPYCGVKVIKAGANFCAACGEHL